MLQHWRVAMNKVVETINLSTGQRDKLEMPYTKEEEARAIKKLQFKANGIKMAGWCRTCNKAVVIGQEKYEVNRTINGVVADCFHRRCDR